MNKDFLAVKIQRCLDVHLFWGRHQGGRKQKATPFMLKCPRGGLHRRPRNRRDRDRRTRRACTSLPPGKGVPRERRGVRSDNEAVLSAVGEGEARVRAYGLGVTAYALGHGLVSMVREGQPSRKIPAHLVINVSQSKSL